MLSTGSVVLTILSAAWRIVGVSNLIVCSFRRMAKPGRRALCGRYNTRGRGGPQRGVPAGRGGQPSAGAGLLPELGCDRMCGMRDMVQSLSRICRVPRVARAAATRRAW
jgi:hypothetical protein